MSSYSDPSVRLANAAPKPKGRRSIQKFGLLLAALAVIAGGWWYASPYWTLQQMKAAADRGDTARLSAFIDYPAVRQDLKAQMHASVLHGAGGDSGLAGLGSAIASAMLDPLVDAMVTPEGLQTAFAHRRAATAATAGSGGRLSAPDRPIVDHQGLDRFTARDRKRDQGSLLFRRDGLGWKLVGFELPKGAGS